MRIGFVITRSDRIGGALIHVKDLARVLQREGHDVTVLTGGEGVLTEELREQGTPCISLRYLVRNVEPLTDLRGLVEMRAAIKRLHLDIVSTHSAKAGSLGRVAAWSLGVPVLYTAHGWAFTDGVPTRTASVYRWIERLAAPFADRIITVCDYDRELAIRQHVASASRITAIHNGMPDVSPELRAHPERTSPHLVMIARFEEQKDHPTLLRALATLTSLEWTLELLGDGPRWEQMRALASALGLSERVQFVGARRDIPERLARAQLLLLITNWEGFPRSILEAMRAGLPVIASRVAGAAESVIDGETGCVVPPGDVGRLSEALRALIVDGASRRRMGDAGRLRYEQCFTFDQMYTRTTAVYRAVLELRRRPSAPFSAPVVHTAARRVGRLTE